MKTLLRLLSLTAALCGVVVVADPLNITVDSSGNLLNGIGIATGASSQYAPGDNNPSSNLSFLNQEIGRWNGAFNPDLPAASGPVAFDSGNLNGVSSYTTLSGYDYVVFHFGNGPAGPTGESPGGWWQAYYLAGEGGFLFSLPVINNESVGGFSSARYFGGHEVPEGSATVVLLGLGLVAVAYVSRRTKQA